MARRFLMLVLSVALPLSASMAAAVAVVPAERVHSRVIVRAEARRDSGRVGGLRPGEKAHLIASQAGWHRVVLPNGRTGYVSASWTALVPEPPPPSRGDFVFSALQPVPSFGQRLAQLAWRLLRPLRRHPRVDFEIHDPALGHSERKHFDPRLPVAGFATTEGAHANFDVLLLIDTSASTGEFAQTDVDGDGRGVDQWQGADSILRAEIRAARAFVRILRRLPGNHAGQRIHVGLVTFAGEDRLHTWPADRGFDPTLENLHAIAGRDAVLELPLSADYVRVDKALAAIGKRTPSGTTDLAAGVTRAVIELSGNVALGATRAPRAAVHRVVEVLSDGKPRLPYDRVTASRAARYAGYLAQRAGVRINSFELGRNDVTREHSESLKHLASITGGRFVHIKRPGDVVGMLAATKLSFVDRVKLVNRTTGEETPYVATGIDGSFYGELPLLAGENEVEVVAVLQDDRQASLTLQVRFQPVPRDVRLAEELDHIREENAVLVEQIRQHMAAALAEKRHEAARQRRELEVRAEASPASRAP